jgi:hypothetical protein
MMKDYRYPTDSEQLTLMDIVVNECIKRGHSYDNYNEQELAYRQAIADGAMRLTV